IMGIKHRQRPIYGLQFHPESVLTPEGLKIVANFLRMARI
ncbi:MAG: aminodeoxychorismate/anthranilate synthase component II, partial [Candidatus Methanoperedens sp.]|nr:aminodeoxychorismate/anthranilate synthase component II [Candidatus Methanoperedens sp.]